MLNEQGRRKPNIVVCTGKRVPNVEQSALRIKQGRFSKEVIQPQCKGMPCVRIDRNGRVYMACMYKLLRDKMMRGKLGKFHNDEDLLMENCVGSSKEAAKLQSRGKSLGSNKLGVFEFFVTLAQYGRK
jgi:hypothetical protein